MLVSACVIARDEAGNLAACIASVAGFADEVVVYDTGSVDATVEVARAGGAVVVQGVWPGGFAAARNAALAHCAGDWVLSLDADERLRCADPGQVRARLRHAPGDLLALQVSIDNLTGVGTGSGYAHVADRLFRRARCEWRGRLHEQLFDVRAGTLARSRYLAEIRLVHHGYLAATVDDHAKSGRNLGLARAEVEDPSVGDRGVALVMLGRALWSADQPEEALTALLAGAAETGNPTARRQGWATATRILLRLDRLDEAATVTAQLRAASTRPVLADLLTAGGHMASGRDADALALLDPIRTTVRDDDGYEHGPHTTAEWRAAALVGLGRPGEAADLLLGLLHDRLVLDADLDLVVESLERAGRPLDDLARVVPAALLPGIVAAALRLEPHRGNTVLHALWRSTASSSDVDIAESGAGDADPSMTVLVGAALLARLLPAADAVVWSRRLRHRGLDDLCPLIAVAADSTIPPAGRVAAAVAAVHAFGDERASAPFASALAGLDPAGVTALRYAGLPAGLQPLADAVTGAEPTVRRATTGEPAPAVSVVMLATGGAQQVLGCLQALAGTLPEVPPFEIVVVDNASTDGTGRVLADLGGDVVVVRSDTRISEARARNLGAGQARGPVLVFVDADARPQAGWLDALLPALADDSRLGAVAPLLVAASGQTWSAGADVRLADAAPVPTGGLARRTWGPSGGPRQVAVDWDCGSDSVRATSEAGLVAVMAAPATVLAVRREAFAEVGGFDEGYWDGGEDFDLCFALRSRGWEVGCRPTSRVVVADPVGADIAPWARVDHRPLLFADAVGPRRQLDDNRTRFATRWASALSNEAVGPVQIGVQTKPLPGSGPKTAGPAGRAPAW